MERTLYKHIIDGLEMDQVIDPPGYKVQVGTLSVKTNIMNSPSLSLP